MVSHSDLSRLAVVDELEVGSARRVRSPPSLTSRQGRRARRSRPSRARERAVLTIRCPKSAAAARGVKRTDSQVYDTFSSLRRQHLNARLSSMVQRGTHRRRTGLSIFGASLEISW